ncbi:endospore germination permease [Bacillus sp. FSL W7-1294]|uniref:endospore germination permease n=1 Tax=Bacillus TaxID=1386 RepID=UPI0012B6A8F3|nr:endospore germination permease [Bacillus cereus]
MVNFFQIALVLIGSTGIINHVIIIPMLLDYSGRDSWISIIVLSLVYIIWIPFVFIIHKQTSEEHLFAWLIRNYGGFITYPLLSILILYLIMLGIVTLKETLTFFSFYLPETPRILLGTVLSIICFYNIQRGIQSIALTTGILLPVVFMLGFFVMIANFPHKDYSLLKPILEHGMDPVIKGMIYPAFEEWRLVSIGKYIEHLDFLSVYQWLVGVFIRISLVIFLIPDVLQVTKQKARNQIISIVLICMVIICILPISDASFYWFLSYVFLPISAIGLFLFSMLLLVFVWVSKNKERA